MAADISEGELREPLFLEPYTYFGKELQRRASGSMIATEMGYESALKMPEHSHGTEHLAILVEGAYLERDAEEVRFYLPGDAVFYEADRLHRNEFGLRPGRCWNLEFPIGRTPQEIYQTGRLLPAEVARLIESGGTATGGQAQSCATLARRVVENSPWLSIHEIADRLSHHPSHVARAFHKSYGISLGRFAGLTKLRLAAERVVATSDSLAEIAFDTGFFDQSHLTNALRTLTGFTPSRLRSIAHG